MELLVPKMEKIVLSYNRSKTNQSDGGKNAFRLETLESFREDWGGLREVGSRGPERRGGEGGKNEVAQEPARPGHYPGPGGVPIARLRLHLSRSKMHWGLWCRVYPSQRVPREGSQHGEGPAVYRQHVRGGHYCVGDAGSPSEGQLTGPERGRERHNNGGSSRAHLPQGSGFGGVCRQGGAEALAICVPAVESDEEADGSCAEAA